MLSVRVLFGRRIKQLRKAKEMTQEELAETAGFIPGHISDIERGLYGPRFDGLEKLAEALGVPIRDLFDFSKLPESLENSTE